MRTLLMIVGPAALTLMLGACDREDYEARITELEGQLQTAQTEAQDLRGQLDTAQSRVVELESAATPSAGPDLEQLREPMAQALAALRETDDQLVQLEQALGTEGLNNVSLDPLRTNLAEAGRAMGEAAQIAGIDVTTLEPQQQ